MRILMLVDLQISWRKYLCRFLSFLKVEALISELLSFWTQNRCKTLIAVAIREWNSSLYDIEGIRHRYYLASCFFSNQKDRMEYKTPVSNSKSRKRSRKGVSRWRSLGWSRRMININLETSDSQETDWNIFFYSFWDYMWCCWTRDLIRLANPSGPKRYRLATKELESSSQKTYKSSPQSKTIHCQHCIFVISGEGLIWKMKSNWCFLCF